MKNTSKSLLTLLAIGAGIASIALTIFLYINTPTKRDDIHVELIKIICQGAVIGLLGLWVKQLFEKAAKERELERERVEKRIEQERLKREYLIKTIDLLIGQCRTLIRIADAEGTTVAALEHEDIEALLHRWRSVEPDGPANRAVTAFDNLIKVLKNMDMGKNTKSAKDKAKLHFEDWLKYYEEFSLCLALGQYPCSLKEPTDWE